MISQIAGKSNTEMETGSETVGVRAYKKYRQKERGTERKEERVGPLSLFDNGVFFHLFSWINEKE